MNRELHLQGSGSVCSFGLNILAPVPVQCNLISQSQTDACHAMTWREAESDPARSRLLGTLPLHMFSFLQPSAELQKQVLQFIYGGRIKTCMLTAQVYVTHFNQRQI